MGFDLFSPGCNCKLIFTPNNANACEGTFTWCTKVGSKVKLQKNNGSWVDIVTIPASSPQFYTINTTSQAGLYRLQCELCPGKWATSDPVTTTLCGNHSYWYRWFKKNKIIDIWNPRGAYLAQVGPNYAIRDVYDETFGTSNFNGVLQKYDELFPYPYGCSNDNTTYRSGNITIYSLSQHAIINRNGYTFDYRIFHNVVGPGCSTGFSLNEIFPNRGLIGLGAVSHHRTWTTEIVEIARRTVEFQLGTFFNFGPITPSSGPGYSHVANVIQTADISLLLPRVTDPFPYQWPDGTYTPNLPFDNTGNTYGVIQSNRQVAKNESGTKLPSSCNLYNALYVDLNTWGPFTNAKVVYNFTPEEFKTRTCEQFANNTNPLPPGTVLENDNCIPLEASNFSRPCLP